MKRNFISPLTAISEAELMQTIMLVSQTGDQPGTGGSNDLFAHSRSKLPLAN